MPLLYWFNVAASQPLLVWVILIWKTSPADLTVSAGRRRIAYLGTSRIGPQNQYSCYSGISTTQSPSDVTRSSSAGAELSPWLPQAGPLEVEGLGTSSAPKGLQFYFFFKLTTAFPGCIPTILPVSFIQHNSENKPFGNKIFSRVLPPEVIRCGWLGGGQGLERCKRALSAALRNAVWVLKMSLIAQRATCAMKSPCATLGPWALGRRGRGKGPANSRGWEVLSNSGCTLSQTFLFVWWPWAFSTAAFKSLANSSLQLQISILWGLNKMKVAVNSVLLQTNGLFFPFLFLPLSPSLHPTPPK